MIFASPSQQHQEAKRMGLILLLISCGCAVSWAQLPSQILERGFSDQYKSENTLGEYTFGYNEDHTSGGSFRRETGDRQGNKVGSYGLRVGDGRVRVVNYVADHNGFRADVMSNEPGVEAQDSNQFSKFTKRNIYAVLVPGFQYSSSAPYVTFDGDRQAKISDSSSYDANSNNFQREDPRNEFVGENVYDENVGNIYSDRDESVLDDYYEDDHNNFFMDDGQVLQDSYLNAEYSHDLETVYQNSTADSPMVDDANRSVYENSNRNTTSATVASNDSQENLRQRSENVYSYEEDSGDLHPFQSSVVLNESDEIHRYPDSNSTTLQELKFKSTSNNDTSEVA